MTSVDEVHEVEQRAARDLLDAVVAGVVPITNCTTSGDGKFLNAAAANAGVSMWRNVRSELRLRLAVPSAHHGRRHVECVVTVEQARALLTGHGAQWLQATLDADVRQRLEGLGGLYDTAQWQHLARELRDILSAVEHRAANAHETRPPR